MNEMASGIYRVEYSRDAGPRTPAWEKGEGEYHIPAPQTQDYTILDLWITDYAGNIYHSTILYWLSPGHHIKDVRPLGEDSSFIVKPLTRNFEWDPVTAQYIIADTSYSFHIELEPTGYLMIKLADQRR